MTRLPLHRDGSSRARQVVCRAVVVLLVTLVSVRADDTTTSTNAVTTPAAANPGSPSDNHAPLPSNWTFHPIVLTNLAPQPFLEEHPDQAPASDDMAPPAERPALSLQPGGTNNAPDVVAPNAGDFSAGYHSQFTSNWGGDLASHLLVVYNLNDADSKDLADYYAARRNIPAERVLGISCPLKEEISRKEYEDTIRVPILTYLSVKNWIDRAPMQMPMGNREINVLMATRNEIWAIVLMRGVPLKIENDPDNLFGMETKPELQTNAASVDSELALLPVFGLPLGGFVPNVFYDGLPGGMKMIGPELARNMILVTRLDGPKVSDVRRMIDDSIYAEQHRLAGLAIVDSRGLTDERDGYTSGDDWLRGAHDALLKAGWTVKFDDKPELISPTDPCNEVAIYLGWYAGDAYGPFFGSPPRFVRGAIAYHLHSFSANTLRSETSNWVGPLIAHGAAATMGTVYEPFLALTPHEDIFARRLLAGDYFAAAAWSSERGLSWMLTVVGDPLYRPFRPTIDDALAQNQGGPRTDHDDWLALQKVRLGYEQGVIPADPKLLTDAIDVPGAGPVALEGLGDLLLELKTAKADDLAEGEYRKAADADHEPINRIRLALKLADFYRAHGRSAQAQAELDNMRDLFPNDATRFGIPSTLVPTSVQQPPPAPNARPQLPQLPTLPKPTPSQ